MAETLRGGLSLGLGGFGFWSHDISGFEQCATPDIYKRWCAFGLLSSHSRLHGGTTYRVPWLFDDEANDVLRYFVNLKCELMPYLYAKAIESTRSGLPMVRPMVLEFLDDRTCQELDLQYMLGDSLMVAPIFREDGEVEYYLPEGKWVHLLDGRIKEGGKWYQENYDYMSLPLFVRENRILLKGASNQKPDYNYIEGITVMIPEFTEGASAEAVIPNTAGEEIAKVSAIREENIIKIEISEDTEWNIEKLGTQPQKIEKDGRIAKLYM